MKIELKEINLNDSELAWEMYEELGSGENGFSNNLHNLSIDEFRSKIEDLIDSSKTPNLELGRVAQSHFWLYVDNEIVGIAKLRHELNENLRKKNGHIGYSIRPSKRRLGFGNIILAELIKKAQKLNINELLVTCLETNIASIKVIKNNKGVLNKTLKGLSYFWIALD